MAALTRQCMSYHVPIEAERFLPHPSPARASRRTLRVTRYILRGSSTGIQRAAALSPKGPCPEVRVERLLCFSFVTATPSYVPCRNTDEWQLFTVTPLFSVRSIASCSSCIAEKRPILQLGVFSGSKGARLAWLLFFFFFFPLFQDTDRLSPYAYGLFHCISGVQHGVGIALAPRTRLWFSIS